MLYVFTHHLPLQKGVSKLKVTDILLFLGTDYTEKH